METQSKEDLLLAVKEGNLEKVKHILSSNFHIIADDEGSGYNLLIAALQQGHKNIIHFLLDTNCKIDEVPKTNIDHTLLHYAISLNDIDIVKKLLEKGISIYDKKHGDDIPIYLAVKNNQFEIVDLLLSNSYHCNVGENNNLYDLKEYVITTFFIACQRNNLNVIKDFINLGVPIDSIMKSGLLQIKFYGYTPLHFAVDNVCLETVKYLLYKGANSILVNINGLTALHLAYEIKDKINEQIKNQYDDHCDSKIKLNKKLEDIDAIIHQFVFHTMLFDFLTFDNNKAVSLFYITCMNDDPEIFYQSYHSKRNKNNLRLQNVECYSPLNSCKKTLESLFNNTLDVNAKLDAAINKNHQIYNNDFNLKVLRSTNMLLENDKIIDSLLMNASKSTNPGTVKGLSHFHIACTRNNLDLIQKFLENKISIDAKVDFKSDKFPGFSALHFAVGFSQIEVVELLLRNKANVNSKDATESTPLHLASLYIYLGLNQIRETASFGNPEKIRNWIKNCKNQVKIIELLLKYNADVNAKNIIGATPLYYAFGNNFIKKEFEHSVTYYCKMEPLIFSKLNIIQKEIVDLLISYDADVNSSTFSGSTVLHNASVLIDIAYYSSAHKSLLSANCNVNVKDKQGKTPLHLACQNKNVNAISELLNYGADINIQDNNKETVFCFMNSNSSYYSHFVFFVLQKHFKKMIALGYYIIAKVKWSYIRVCNRYEKRRHAADYFSSSDDSDSEDDYYDCDLEFKNDIFSIECREEIKRMKTIKLSRYSTLYDILYKDSNEMTKYIKNEILINILTSDNLYDHFPIYSEFLKSRFRKGCARDVLLNPAKEVMNFITKTGFPDACSEQVLKYLTNDDLKNLIKCNAGVSKRKFTYSNIYFEPLLKYPRL